MTPTKNERLEKEGKFFEPLTYEDGLMESSEIILSLAAEIEALKDQVLIGGMDQSNEQKRATEAHIADLRGQIRTLEAANFAAVATSNFNMNRVADLTSQIRYWKRRAIKAEKALS